MRKNPYKPAPEPFQVIYKKLALPLTKFIVKRVGGDQDAVEEVFSRTLEAAWKGWNSFEHKSTYFTGFAGLLSIKPQTITAIRSMSALVSSPQLLSAWPSTKAASSHPRNT